MVATGARLIKWRYEEMSTMQEAADHAHVIRTWIVERVTLLVDNDRVAFGEVTDAACWAVLGHGTDRFDYEYHHQGGDGRDRYADAVGAAVTNVIDEWIGAAEDDRESFLYALLREVLDLTDGAQAYLFGLHYLPEPVDMRAWAEENGERGWLGEA